MFPYARLLCFAQWERLVIFNRNIIQQNNHGATWQIPSLNILAQVLSNMRQNEETKIGKMKKLTIAVTKAEEATEIKRDLVNTNKIITLKESMEPYITALGTVLSVLGGVWAIVAHKTKHLEDRIDSQDEKIFLLATGKTLREAMLEIKQRAS